MRNINCWRNNTGRKGNVSFGMVGSSDILGIMTGGRFLAIEVKKPGGKLSEAQRDFIEDINIRGGLAFMATCIEDVEKELK